MWSHSEERRLHLVNEERCVNIQGMEWSMQQSKMNPMFKILCIYGL